MTKLVYRPDIDGLRAIAILSVIGYHAFPSAITGGFFGVDIFFVISGYLISSIIFIEFNNKCFTFHNFYFRRCRRIIPALLLLLITVWVFGWFVLFPDEFIQLGYHIFGGLTFVNNFIFLNEVNYFDNAAETKQLLHLWSLGIEEQFYIVWPIIIFIAWHKKVNLLTISIIIAYISFLSNNIIGDANISFYHPLYRFWELMVGGILAVILVYKNNIYSGQYFNIGLVSTLGILLLIFPIIFIDKANLYLYTWALFPTLGTFILIASEKSLIHKYILENRILVYIGLISYPLYLWHWSLFSFAHILNFTSIENKLFLIMASFTLAVITYEIFEKKIKRYNSVYLVSMLIFLSILLGILAYITKDGMISPRNNTEIVKLISEAKKDWTYPKGLINNLINGIPTYVKKGATEKVIFYGDSHIEQYSSRVIKIIEQDNKNIKTAIFITSGGCPPIPNIYRDNRRLCTKELRDTFEQLAHSENVSTIVVGASWGGYLVKPGRSDTYYLKGDEKIYLDKGGIGYALKSFEEFIIKLAKSKKVYLVVDNPIGKEYNPINFIEESSRLYGIKESKIFTKNYTMKETHARNKLIAIAQKANAIIIDPVQHFCFNNICRTALDDGTPIYKDTGHIRSSYVEKYIDYIDVTLK